MNLSDFFLNEDIFIAYGSEKCLPDDFKLEADGNICTIFKFSVDS